MANSWQMNCNEVRPSTRVRIRHCSEVICTCGFRSRRAERFRGSNTISGRMNEVSIHLGARGAVTGRAGESDAGTGEPELPNIFKTGIGDSGGAKDTLQDGLSATEISCDALICAGGVAIRPGLCCSSTAAYGASLGAIGDGKVGTEAGAATPATVGAAAV